MVAASARLEEKVGHLADALSMLTETSEAGFKAIADELTRRAAAAPPAAPARRRRSRASRRRARKGTSIAEIAAAEHMSEGEVRLRLHLAEHAPASRARTRTDGRSAPMRCAHEACGRWAPRFLANGPGRGLVLDEAWFCSRGCLEAETRRAASRTRRRPSPTRCCPARTSSRLGALLVHRKLITTATLDAGADAAGRQRPPPRRRAGGDGRAATRWICCGRWRRSRGPAT